MSGSPPAAMPTLDEIRAGVSTERRKQIMLACSAILAALAASGPPPSMVEAVQAAPKEDDRLMDAGEAAAFLGFAKSYVYEIARRGEFPVVRRGRYVRIRRSALVQWIEKKEKGLDFEVSNMLSSTCGGRRSKAAPQAAGAYAGGARREARHSHNDGKQVGARSGETLEADCSRARAAREDG